MIPIRLAKYPEPQIKQSAVKKKAFRREAPAVLSPGTAGFFASDEAVDRTIVRIYPLIAPLVTPKTIYRWKNMKKSTGTSEKMVAPARS